MANKDQWLKKIVTQRKSIIDISVNNNQDTNINLNILLPPSEIIRNHLKRQSNVDSKISSLKLENDIILETAYDKEVYLLQYLEQVKKEVQKKRATPIIRMQQLYSGFCTQWEPSNMTDISQMELLEKRLLIELVRLGCEFRIIINLDVQFALANKFSEQEILKRVADLCSVCDMLFDYKNFQLAIEEKAYMIGNQLSIDNVLGNQLMNFQDRGNYSFSRWHSDQSYIEKYNEYFDFEFFLAREKNNVIMRAMKYNKISELIEYFLQERLKG